MQLRSKFFAVALAAAGLVASNASAATVTYILDLSTAGAFTLKADVSQGDNGGLVAFGVGLTGTLTTLDLRAPNVINAANFAPAGFSEFRSPAAPDGGPAVNPFVSGSQNAIAGPPANRIYGFGQEASSYAAKGITPAFLPDPTVDIAWLDPIVLAVGTYTGTLTFNQSNVNNAANVWESVGSGNAPAATLAYQIIPLPSANTAPIVTSDGGSLGEAQTFNGQVITHDFDAIDAETPAGPFTWNVALNGSPTFLFPGAVDNSAFPTIDSNGTFSWNTLGAARGIYNWLITASDPGGETSTPQQFAVTVTAVPEPSTIALFGLAMVGALGFVRRRNG